MSDPKTLTIKCNCCDKPLFLDKKECREFIEGKLKHGYIVCSCCGSKQELTEF